MKTEKKLIKYQSDKEEPLALIEKLSFNKDKNLSYHSAYGKLIFIMKGSLLISVENMDDSVVVNTGQMFFIAPHIPVNVYILEDLTLIVNRIPDCMIMCNQISLTKRDWSIPSRMHTFKTIDIKAPTDLFINSLGCFLDDGLNDRDFHEIKIEELYYILKNYYEKEELKELFHPILSKNFPFANFVLNNYTKVKTAKELAKLSHYSVSGFEKEFKQVFQSSPYQWMLKKKSKKIYHEIKQTNKPLKNIAEEFGFVNLSQFCDFCRRHFKNSPGKIRKL